MARPRNDTSVQAPANAPTLNTDRHLWPDTSDPDGPLESIHVTAEGAIGINVAGNVVVRPLREWHSLSLNQARIADYESALQIWRALGMDAAAILEEIANARVSQTMTEHRAADLLAERNAVLAQLAARIRELLGA